MKCSSASLMVPFRPSSNRSLKSVGSYSPSSSQISVPDMAQISSSRCQSALLRASRETSRPNTIPAWPMLTSATRRWKPSRSAAEAPDWPWSVSMVTIASAGQPSAVAFCRNAYWRVADSVLVSTCRSVDWRTYR